MKNTKTNKNPATNNPANRGYEAMRNEHDANNPFENYEENEEREREVREFANPDHDDDE